MSNWNNEEASSPVIGTIILVAIVVTLAAVIAAYSFGMQDNIEMTKSIAVTAKQIDDKIEVTYHGGNDHNKVVSINASTYHGGTLIDSDSMANPNISQYISLDGGTNDQDRIMVTASFSDGTTQLIYDDMI